MMRIQDHLFGAGIAAAVFCADQLCKAQVRTHADTLRKDNKPAVRLTYAENRGFALNLGEEHPVLVRSASLAAAAACAAAFIPVVQGGSPAQTAGVSLLLGGGLSNTADRIIRGRVTDYIGIGKVVYNLADFAVFAGLMLCLAGEAGHPSASG